MALLEIKDLSKTFDAGTPSETVAAYHLDLSLERGVCVAVVGESGCGKSTLAKLITCVEKPDSGSIVFDGTELAKLSRRELRQKRRMMQMVFQQPVSAISPRMTIGSFMKVPLVNFGIVSREDLDDEVDRLLAMVQLPPSYKDKLPHEVSGGELQRVMIARAMAGRPALLICDEATSALDVAVQQEIIDLINRLKDETGVACIFITHDLSLVRQVSQRVIVMYRGRIVEKMSSRNIVSEAGHPYTKLLLSSVFGVNCDQDKVPDVMPEDALVEREEYGCPFYGRCPLGEASCGNTEIMLEEASGDGTHLVACPKTARGKVNEQ
ncbi:MAG: ABC transporter ATP-binding protein [Eubacteriaceae bacterium]|nr:ABC transporter ATP-binding protein [Eubacteriaceae bacterium]